MLTKLQAHLKEIKEHKIFKNLSLRIFYEDFLIESFTENKIHFSLKDCEKKYRDHTPKISEWSVRKFILTLQKEGFISIDKSGKKRFLTVLYSHNDAESLTLSHTTEMPINTRESVKIDPAHTQQLTTTHGISSHLPEPEKVPVRKKIPTAKDVRFFIDPITEKDTKTAEKPPEKVKSTDKPKKSCYNSFPSPVDNSINTENNFLIPRGPDPDKTITSYCLDSGPNSFNKSTLLQQSADISYKIKADFLRSVIDHLTKKSSEFRGVYCPSKYLSQRAFHTIQILAKFAYRSIAKLTFSQCGESHIKGPELWTISEAYFLHGITEREQYHQIIQHAAQHGSDSLKCPKTLLVEQGRRVLAKIEKMPDRPLYGLIKVNHEADIKNLGEFSCKERSTNIVNI